MNEPNNTKTPKSNILHAKILTNPSVIIDFSKMKAHVGRAIPLVPFKTFSVYERAIAYNPAGQINFGVKVYILHMQLTHI